MPAPRAQEGMLRHQREVALELVAPSEGKREAFVRMAQERLDGGSDRYRLALTDFDGYLARLRQRRDPSKAPTGWVPGAEFWLEDGEGEIVACVRLRFWLTPALEVEGGHIGHDVRPSARCRGFGTVALGLWLCVWYWWKRSGTVSAGLELPSTTTISPRSRSLNETAVFSRVRPFRTRRENGSSNTGSLPRGELST